MLTATEQERYSRHLVLSEIGVAGQLKLKQAKVLIIGAGGLGCPVAQYLCAAGVGTVGLVDFDVVSLSNLQRQILFSTADVGRLKVEVAKERILALNPHVQVNAYAEKWTPAQMLQNIAGYDIIADCTDNYASRYLINDACVTVDKPFVSASVYKFETQLSVYNYKNGPTYRCLFPEPPEEALNCAEAGVVGVLTGISGCLQANEIVKMLVGKGEVLSGKLLVYNALNNQQMILTVKRDEIAVEKIKALKGNLSGIAYEHICITENGIHEISAIELKRKLDVGEVMQLMDVREEFEHEMDSIGGDVIPLEDIAAQLFMIATDKPVVFYCSSGKRSGAAIRLVQGLLPSADLLHLVGGLEAWNKMLAAGA